MLSPSEMKDRMHKLAQNKDNIEGIYNYCDRWCERCSFTTRCLNFASSKDAPEDGPELWDYLHNVFEATMLMLDEMMEKMGLDPEEIKNLEPPEEYDPREHPLYKKVYEFSFTIHKWLEKNKPGENDTDVFDIIPGNKKSDSRYNEAFEVIYFYNFFISAKIFRALTGIDEDESDEIQTDSNGSAKIALIAIDRLIAAWSVAMEKLSEHEDEIIRFLIILSEIRKQTELAFPNARKFVRAGFDGQPLSEN
jgi:hypothetical protein